MVLGGGVVLGGGGGGVQGLYLIQLPVVPKNSLCLSSVMTHKACTECIKIV